ncbi:unnamed protein product, partial [Mesorhabditis belari]|uniref:CAP-Gly domain-containing protein n=1 Tax=Mesorhabditis belari TaxID=2138241 RepID=A0AAF3J544_9BILA
MTETEIDTTCVHPFLTSLGTCRMGKCADPRAACIFSLAANQHICCAPRPGAIQPICPSWNTPLLPMLCDPTQPVDEQYHYFIYPPKFRRKREMSHLRRTESRESILSSASNASRIGNFEIGDRVEIENRAATIAFIGNTQFAQGEWIGLILDEATGKNDGSLQGIRYFECDPNYGLFCKAGKLKRVAPTPSEPTSPHAAEFGFDVGDKVNVAGGKLGTVRFLDVTKFATGVWAGIELDQPNGKNDGSVQGVSYFECKPMYGLFVPAAKTELVQSKMLMTRHTKSSLLRYQQKRMGGSRESLSSVGASSLASSRIGTVRRPQFAMKPTPPPEGTVHALQEALREKEKHLEQMMQEREMEKMEMARILQRQESTDSSAQRDQLKLVTDALKTTIAEREKKIEELLFSIDELKVDRETVNEELEEARKQLEVFTENMLLTANATNQEQEALMQLNSRLNQELTNSTRLATELDASKRKLAEIEKQREEQTKEFEKITSENTNLQAELSKNKEALGVSDEFEKETTTLREQLSNEKKSKESFESQLSESKSQLDALNKDLLAKRDKHEKLLSEASTLQVDTENLRKKLEAEKAEIEQKNSALSEEVTALRTAIEVAQNERKTADEASAKQVEAIKAELKQMGQQLETGSDTQKALVKMSEEKMQIEADREKITSELKLTMEQMTTLKKDHQSTVERMQKALEETQMRLTTLEKEHDVKSAEHAKFHADHVGLQAELSSTKDQLVAAGEFEKEALALRTDLQNEKSIHQGVQQQLKEAHDKLESLDKDLSMKRDEHEKLLSLSTSLQEEFEKRKMGFEAEKSEIEQKNSTLAKEISALRLEIQAAQNEKILADEANSKQIDALKAELKQMGQQLETGSDAQQALVRMSEEKLEIEADRTKISNDLKLSVGQLEILKNEHQSTVKRMQATMDENQTKLAALEKELAVKGGEHEKLQVSNVALQTELSSIKEQLSAAGEFEKEAATLRTELQTEKLAKEGVQSQLKEANEELNAIDMKLQTKSTEWEELSSENAKLQAELSTTREQLVVAAEFEKEVLTLRTDLQTEKSTKESAQEQLKETSDKLTALENELFIQRTEHEKISSEMALLQEELEKTKTTAEAEKGESEQKCSSLANEVALLRAEMETSQNERNASEQSKLKEVDSLKSELKQMAEQLAIGSDTQKALAKMSEEKKQSDAEREKISNELQLNVSQLAALRSEHQSVTQTHDEVTSELAQTQQSLATITGKLEDKERELQKQTVNEQEIRKNLDEARAEAENLKATSETEINRLEREAATLRSQVECSGQSNEQVSVELSSAASQVSQLSSEKTQLQSEMETLRVELTRLQMVETEVKQRENDAENKVKLLFELDEAWKQKEARFVERIDELEAKVESEKRRTASDEVTTLQQQVDFLNSIIATMQKKNDTLEKENKKMKETGYSGLEDDFGSLTVKKAAKVAPRKYCDICEIFDAHETEDCPTQSSMIDEFREHSHNSTGSSWPGATEPDRKTPVKKVIPPERPYCEQCEVFGHTKGNGCPSGKSPKVDYTF